MKDSASNEVSVRAYREVIFRACEEESGLDSIARECSAWEAVEPAKMREWSVRKKAGMQANITQERRVDRK